MVIQEKDGEPAPSPAGVAERSAIRARFQRTTWRCRLLGHAGEWSRARTNGVHWFSRCPRCHQQVVRSCSGGGWSAATEANGGR